MQRPKSLKIILIIYLILFSKICIAYENNTKWISILASKDTEDFIDQNSITRTQENLFATSLLNYRKKIHVYGGDIRSIKVQERYYCREKVYDILELTSYSGEMATGKILQKTIVNNDALQINDGSPAEAKLNYLCNKIPNR